MSLYNWEHHLRRRFTHHPVGQSHLGGGGLTGLYWTNAIRDVGLALVNIFIPIYLYRQFGSVSLVFFFFAVYHLSVVLMAYPVAGIVGVWDWIIQEFRRLVKSRFFCPVVGQQTFPWLIW